MRKTLCCLLTPCLRSSMPCVEKDEDIDPKTIALINPIEVHRSYVKGLGKARNDLVKRSRNAYLLFVDCGVSFSKHTFEAYIKPAIQRREILMYQGENRVLCTRVFGIPRGLFMNLAGFDESFHFGEDIEFGCRIEEWMSKTIIPKDLIDHREHQDRSSYLDNLRVRTRVALRYSRFDLLKPQRKKDLFGIFVIPFLCFYYWKNNERKDIDV